MAAGLREEPLPEILLQPWEGATTASVIRDAGRREPHRIPAPLARLLVRAGYAASGLSGDRLRAAVRRVELAWFGQDQDDTWAERHGLDVERFIPTIHGVRAADTIRKQNLPLQRLIDKLREH